MVQLAIIAIRNQLKSLQVLQAGLVPADDLSSLHRRLTRRKLFGAPENKPDLMARMFLPRPAVEGTQESMRRDAHSKQDNKNTIHNSTKQHKGQQRQRDKTETPKREKQ